MKTRRRKNANPVRRRRRGVTLVEMLVTLAVLLLMMALVVQIFQAATTSMNAAQVYQRLDDDLRRLDSTIRSDLSGATARFTPPIDPADDQGYFEYTENEFADNDGEDCDDTIRLTVQAPEDRPFIGRMWAKPPKVLLADGTVYQMTYADLVNNNALANYLKSQPITVTSKHAEVIYFLRNGNLYRRVLLIAPELQTRIVHSYSGFGAPGQNYGIFPGLNTATGVGLTLDPTKGAVQVPFTPGAFGGTYQVSWQGVNDLSAHPSPRGTPLANQFNSVILNKLGDLTDRHKRFSMPRFSDDLIGPDGVADDLNSDSVPDWYPTVSTRILEEYLNGPDKTFGLYNPSINDPAIRTAWSNFRDRFAFPYLFRGSYSRAQGLNNFPWYGWIHAPAPFASDGTNVYRSDQIQYLKYLNHNPLDLGDNLPAPTNSNETGSNNRQTFWGWPTWRETLAPEWNDPTFQVNQTGGAYFPNALLPHTYTEVTQGYIDPTGVSGQQLLPPLLPAWRGSQFDPFTEGAGSNTGFFSGNSASGLWGSASWEDDLILTNVRSFDVKAFEPALADYADLGWGDDQRITAAATSTIPGTTTRTLPNLGTGKTTPPYIDGTWDAINPNTVSPNAYAFIHGRPWHVLNETFAHEGRMPPLKADCRFDAQFGAQIYPNYVNNGNLGDDSDRTIRMRRIWDSWSTTYSKAIATGVLPGGSGAGAGAGFPYGPPFSPPINPSYPPPYPAPLRGIQIQVRVTDPTNQRIKVLTIRQDFTDKL